MAERYSKDHRILRIYEDLCNGLVLRKDALAQRFGVDERTVQRDIDDVRAFLAESATENGDSRLVEYDREKKGFILSGNTSPLMSNSEILAVSKILLDSRAFTKEEMSSILNKLVTGCVPLKNTKLVAELLSNEMFTYVELKEPVGIQDKLWELGSDIYQHELLEICYRRQNNEPVCRVVEPVAILFSEYYFYLNAYLTTEENGRYVRAYDHPTVYRIDRIDGCKKIGQKFNVPYSDRFQEGEFRKRSQFMYSGKLVKLRLRYTGHFSVTPILDRLPTANIVGKDDKGLLIEAEVFGKGVIKWLLSQSYHLEVLRPEEIREEMRDKVEKMWEMYR